jgi:hypothetical protein
MIDSLTCVGACFLQIQIRQFGGRNFRERVSMGNISDYNSWIASAKNFDPQASKDRAETRHTCDDNDHSRYDQSFQKFSTDQALTLVTLTSTSQPCLEGRVLWCTLREASQ